MSFDIFNAVGQALKVVEKAQPDLKAPDTDVRDPELLAAGTMKSLARSLTDLCRDSEGVTGRFKSHLEAVQQEGEIIDQDAQLTEALLRTSEQLAGELHEKLSASKQPGVAAFQALSVEEQQGIVSGLVSQRMQDHVEDIHAGLISRRNSHMLPSDISAIKSLSDARIKEQFALMNNQQTPDQSEATEVAAHERNVIGAILEGHLEVLNEETAGVGPSTDEHFANLYKNTIDQSVAEIMALNISEAEKLDIINRLKENTDAVFKEKFGAYAQFQNETFQGINAPGLEATKSGLEYLQAILNVEGTGEVIQQIVDGQMGATEIGQFAEAQANPTEIDEVVDPIVEPAKPATMTTEEFSDYFMANIANKGYRATIDLLAQSGAMTEEYAAKLHDDLNRGYLIARAVQIHKELEAAPDTIVRTELEGEYQISFEALQKEADRIGFSVDLVNFEQLKGMSAEFAALQVKFDTMMEQELPYVQPVNLRDDVA